MPYHGDSRATLNSVDVEHALSKGAIISKTVATFVQKVGLIWPTEVDFASFIQGTNVIVHLKLLTNGTNMKTIWFKISYNEDRGNNPDTQVPFRKQKQKTEHWDINILLL